MKSLLNYIYESIQQDKEYIRTHLDEIDDDTVREIIYLMKRTGSIDQEQILAYMSERGIDDVWKHIIRILRDNKDDYGNFVKLINKELKVPTGKDLVSGNNMYKLFDGVFSRSTLEELCAFKQSKNSITRGAGEILCRLIISDANDSTRGDFVFGNKNVVEFKSNGGRVMSSRIKAVEYLNRATEDVLNIRLSNYKELNTLGVFANNSNIDQWFDLVEQSGVNLEDALVAVLPSQFDKSIDKSVRDLIRSNIKDLERPGKVRYETLIRLIGSIQLYFYHKEEGFDYFLVGNESSKGTKDLDDYVCIEGSQLDDVKKIFYLDSIYFSSKPRIGNPQDKAVRVFLNK